jgi:hypothetical protein
MTKNNYIDGTPNRMPCRIERLQIDNHRAFSIIGLGIINDEIKPLYLNVPLKPYDQKLDRETQAHCRSITRNLKNKDTFDEIVEDHTKESIVGNVLHYIQKNLGDIIDNKQPENAVRLNTDPYRKIK